MTLYRDAENSDFKEYLALFRKSFWNVAERDVCHDIAGKMIVAINEDTNKLVGFCDIRNNTFDVGLCDFDQEELGFLAVDVAYRRLGIAKELMKRAIEKWHVPGKELYAQAWRTGDRERINAERALSQLGFVEIIHDFEVHNCIGKIWGGCGERKMVDGKCHCSYDLWKYNG